jgi:hypothetical protein
MLHSSDKNSARQTLIHPNSTGYSTNGSSRYPAIAVEIEIIILSQLGEMARFFIEQAAV